jgi:hypothetical protein
MAGEMSERIRQRYEADFDPGFSPSSVPPPEIRLAAAAEYTAFQMGQINRKLDILIEAIQKLSGD